MVKIIIHQRRAGKGGDGITEEDRREDKQCWKGGSSRCMGINGWAYLRTDESRSREFRFWVYHIPICIGTQVFLE